MIVDWTRVDEHRWYNFLTLNLDHEYFNGLEGVYIIWHGGESPKAVRIGQGVIGDRLKEHRQDPEILLYKNLGLYVTWAKVDSWYRDGIERYLSEQYVPLVGVRFPDAQPIVVNLL